MKKRILSFALIFALLFAVFVFDAAAYSSPFEVPKKASVGAVNTAAEVKYSLREGGRFIYCNNPELLLPFNLGRALMIENDLNGDVFFTSENRNFTGKSILMGLQLRNDSGRDITVTVHNLGYQVGVDWVGQQEWTDFFNTRFSIEPRKRDYAFDEVFTPDNFKEVTYTVPNGKYIYVMGGSVRDAYKNINVGGSADKYCKHGDLVNSAVYFTVDGPKTGVSAAFVCYSSPNSPVTSREQQGYVVSRDGNNYASQYLGSAPYLCAESSIAWNIDDSFANGRNLPIHYTTEYYTNTAQYGAYGEYKNPLTRTINSDRWFTHINPANHNQYIGTDMMPFYCVTEDGQKVVIDTKHNDGAGKPANIGNWMVVYEESLTFKNSGTKSRAFKINMRNNGITAINIRNENGGLLRSIYHYNSEDPVYTVDVFPGDTRTVVLEYVLLANSYGSHEHFITVSDGAEYIPGDVNGDGNINTVDYIMAKRAVIGTFTLTENQFQCADVSSDNAVTAVDYIMIKRHVIGTYTINGSAGK